MLSALVIMQLLLQAVNNAHTTACSWTFFCCRLRMHWGLNTYNLIHWHTRGDALCMQDVRTAQAGHSVTTNSNNAQPCWHEQVLIHAPRREHHLEQLPTKQLARQVLDSRYSNRPFSACWSSTEASRRVVL